MINKRKSQLIQVFLGLSYGLNFCKAWTSNGFKAINPLSGDDGTSLTIIIGIPSLCRPKGTSAWSELGPIATMGRRGLDTSYDFILANVNVQ